MNRQLPPTFEGPDKVENICWTLQDGLCFDRSVGQ